MNLDKLIKIVVIALSLISIVFWATIVMSDEKDGGMITPMIYIAYLTIFIAILFVLFYSITGILAKKGELKKTFMAVGAFLAVILISFLIADSTPVPLKDGGEVSSFASKMVSTGLNSFYFLAIIAIGLMFFSGYNRFKK